MAEADEMRIVLYQLRVKGALLCFAQLQVVRSVDVYLTREEALAGADKFRARCTTASDGLFDLNPSTLSEITAEPLELHCTRGDLLAIANRTESEA